MGRFFTDPTDAHRVVLDDDEWVDLKSRQSFGARQKVREVAYRMGGQATGEGVVQGQVDLRIYEAQIVSLSLNILAWSFKDDRGNPVPVTRQNIELLDPEIADRLIAEVERLNEPKSEPSDSGDGEGAEAGAVGAPVGAGIVGGGLATLPGGEARPRTAGHGDSGDHEPDGDDLQPTHEHAGEDNPADAEQVEG